MRILIGNSIALIGSILMAYTGIIKNKQKLIKVQTVQIGILILSNLVLGGFTGAIINFISMIRNIICYKNKLGLKEKIIITILAVTLSILFNNKGIIGLFPVVAMVVYVWLMNIKEIKRFKLLLAFTMLLWFIYDMMIGSFTSAIFDMITLIASIVTVIEIKIKQSKRKKFAK